MEEVWKDYALIVESYTNKQDEYIQIRDSYKAPNLVFWDSTKENIELLGNGKINN